MPASMHLLFCLWRHHCTAVTFLSALTNNNNVIIPNFTHFTPIVQQKLDLSTSLVSSLSAEVQQMLMELSLTDDELPEEDETRWVDLKCGR